MFSSSTLCGSDYHVLRLSYSGGHRLYIDMYVRDMVTFVGELQPARQFESIMLLAIHTCRIGLTLADTSKRDAIYMDRTEHGKYLYCCIAVMRALDACSSV